MSEEKVLGGFEVETRLQFGEEHLFLVYTTQRILFTHQAKVGTKSMALSRIFGGLADAVGKGPANRKELQRIVALRPDEILKLHKDNFAVGFGQVVRLSMEPESQGKVLMVLVTSDMKVEMLAPLVAARSAAARLPDGLKEKFQYRL
jgi:hypothetical protein